MNNANYVTTHKVQKFRTQRGFTHFVTIPTFIIKTLGIEKGDKVQITLDAQNKSMIVRKEQAQ